MRAHHGSIAREQRVAIEEALKEGRLPALVATSSLELGIDMGAIDLVIQVESPTSVARGLQRIGRAGHQVDEVSVGVIFPKYRGDLLECAVVAERMREGAIEATTVPRTPLDVLAQQIVAMTVMDRWSVADLHAVVARAMPFETLTREALEGVLAMLAGAYPSDEFAELKPRLTWDRVADTVEGRRDARVVAVTSGGTIPDRGLYGVFVAGEAGTPGRRVGELDEEMVYELRAGMHGDVIVLGASSWRVAEITPDRVIVEPAPGQPGKLPFWKGDAVGRPIELGRALGAFVREVEGDLARGAKGRAGALARLRGAPSPRPAGGREPRRLPGGRARGGGRPADRSPDRRGAVPRRAGRLAAGPPHAVRRPRPRPVGDGDRGPPARAAGRRGVQHLVGRRDRDPPAGRRPRRGRGRPLPGCRRRGGPGRRGRRRDRALRVALPRERGAGPAPARAAGRARGRRSGSSASAPPTCSRSPAGTAASRSSSRPTASAWPTSSTCRRCATCCAAWSAARSPSTGWRRRGPRRSPRRSSSTTSRPSCTRATPRSPSGGRRRWRSTATSSASCWARRSCASCWIRPRSRRRSWSARRWSTSARPGSVDQVADLLRRLGDLSADEVAARTRGGSPAAGEWLETLAATRRAIAVRIGGEARWIAVEDAARYRDATGAQPPPGTPAAFLGETRDALGGLLARWARTHGPFLAAEPARRWGLPVGIVEEALTRLVEAGSLLRGEFRPGGAEREWCDPDVLRLLRRRSLARLRREVEPVEPAALARFLPAWQGVAAAPVRGTLGADAPPPLRGQAALERLAEVVDQLAGVPIPASVLERDVLPARVPGYQPRLLDELGALGEVAWVGLRAARPRRRADRALPAGTRRRPAGGARRRAGGARRADAERPGRSAARGDPGVAGPARRLVLPRAVRGRRRRLGPRGARRPLGPGLGRRGHERHLRPAPGPALEATGRRPATAAGPPGDARAARGGGPVVAGGGRPAAGRGPGGQRAGDARRDGAAPRARPRPPRPPRRR